MRWSRRREAESGRRSQGDLSDHPSGRVLVRATALLADGGVVGPIRGVLLLDRDDVVLEVPDDWPDDEAMAALRPKHDLPVIAHVFRPCANGSTRRAVVEFTEPSDHLRVVLWASR
jgi:hypothetical protein